MKMESKQRKTKEIMRQGCGSKPGSMGRMVENREMYFLYIKLGFQNKLAFSAFDRRLPIHFFPQISSYAK